MPKEYLLLLTPAEAAEFIKFLNGGKAADDELIVRVRLQLEEQHAND